MHTRIKLILLSLSISLLPACTNMIGNVVPEKGPTMEEVYESMEPEKTSTLKTSLPMQVSDNTFHQLPNPQLKMYVYPHFAGNEEVPIPGYYTVFDAYEKTHYALNNETIRTSL